MKKIIIIISLFTGLLMFPGCNKYDMVSFDEGGQLDFYGYFYTKDGYGPYQSDDPKYLVWERNFGFNPMGDSLQVDTMRVVVRILGLFADHPRKVVFKANPPKDHALELVFPEEYYVPADTGIAEFKVLVKRPATRDEMYTTQLLIDYAKSDFTAGTQERQVYQLKAEDKVTMELWGTNEEEWYAEYSYAFFLGDYSNTKARFLITNFHCPSFSKWGDSEEFYMVLMMNAPWEALEVYKANPDNPPLLDENTGEWIEFPDLSGMF